MSIRMRIKQEKSLLVFSEEADLDKWNSIFCSWLEIMSSFGFVCTGGEDGREGELIDGHR